MGRWLGHRAVVVATAMLLVASCGAGPEGEVDGGTGDAGGTPTSGAPPGDPGTGTTTGGDGPGAEPGVTTPPPEETTRVEDPQGTREDTVALDLAGLPVGGFAEPLSDTDRCVHVNWSGPPDIPAGVQVRATAVGLQPAGVYELVPGLCSGAPCLGRGNLMDPGVQCVVGVRQVAPTDDGYGALALTAGMVSCPPGEEDACRRFVAEVGALGPDAIEWFDAVGVPTDPSPTSEPDPTGDGPTGDGDGGDTVTRTG